MWNHSVRVQFGEVLSTVFEGVVRVLFHCLVERRTRETQAEQLGPAGRRADLLHVYMIVSTQEQCPTWRWSSGPWTTSSMRSPRV